MAKTIKLETVKANANKWFAISDNELATQRRAIQFFVSDLLMGANAYKGFRYLEANDLEAGKTIGLIRNAENAAGPHIFPDDSRIAFL